MSKPMTLDEARVHAEEARAGARRIRLEAEAEALALELYADEVMLAAAKGLTIARKRAIVRHSMQVQASVRQLGRPSKVKHPFRSHLKRIGSDVASWAAANKESPSTVKAWMRGDRQIPEARAFQIRDEAGKDEAGNWYVPATVATWARGIRT